MAGQSTDWGGIALAVGAVGALYLAYSSGIFNRLAASIQPMPISPLGGSMGGYCSDGSTPNPATGLCANGQAPTTIPIAQSPYQQSPYGPTGGTCTGQDMYTGQPCGCYPPTTSSAMMMYGQMSQQYQPSTPTCNCQMCGQAGGYGSTNPYGTSPYGQSPYGSPYGTSPYGSSPYGTSPYGTSPYGTSPYGSPPGYGVGGIGTGLYPPGYPSYPYGPIGANYSPYPSYPYSPVTLGGIGYPSPILSPVFGAQPGAPGAGFFGGPGGQAGSGFGGGGGFRHGFQGTSDLNAYAGASIARDAYGF